MLGRALLTETDHFLRLSEERAGSVEEMRQVIARYSKIHGSVMMTVWDKGKAVAEGILTSGQLARTAHVGMLGIGVLRAYWGRGIGRALIGQLEARAAALALERLEFTVLSHNYRARDFYQRLGYLEEGRRRRSVRYGPVGPVGSIRYGDEILMAKWIGPDLCLDTDAVGGQDGTDRTEKE